MVSKKDQDGKKLYEPFTLLVKDYSSAHTVGQLVELAKQEMHSDLQNNYDWLLHEIKDHDLPQDLTADCELSRVPGLSERIKITFTIYGYPKIDSEELAVEEMFSVFKDPKDRQERSTTNREVTTAHENIKLASSIMLLQEER